MNLKAIGLLLTFLASLLSPFSVWAGDESCLNQEKERLLRSMSVPAEVAQAFGMDSAHLLTWPRENERFYREFQGLSDKGADELMYTYRLRNGERRLIVRVSLQTPDTPSETALFTEKISYVVLHGSQEPRLYYERFSSILKDCHALESRIRFALSQPGDRGLMEISRIDDLLGRGRSSQRFLKPAIEIIDSITIPFINTPDELRESPSYAAGRTLIYDTSEDSYPETPVSWKPVHDIKIGHDQGTELANGFEVQIGEHGEVGTEKLLETKTGRTVRTSVVGGFRATSESVTRENWLSFPLLSYMDDKGERFMGLSSEDFYAKNLQLLIQGKGEITLYENLPAYMQVRSLQRNGADWSMTVDFDRTGVAPTSSPWGMKLPSDEDRYLQGSQYIQLDAVREFANQLRPNLKGLSRLEAARAIIRWVTSILTFDDDQVNNGAVDFLSTTDILKKRRGVCQHYASLFIAMARSLGLPARMVRGWSVKDLVAIHHAWVEVKISDQVWWPLEPQVDDERLPDFGYIPVTVSRLYDSEGENPAKRVQLTFREQALKLQFQDATYSKIK